MQFLTGIPAKLLAYAGAALAACAALLGAFSGVRRIGRQDAENAALRKAVQNVEVRKDVDAELATRGDDVVADQLRQHWTRG